MTTTIFQISGKQTIPIELEKICVYGALVTFFIRDQADY